MRRFFKEPLVHFIVAGCVVFGAYSLLNPAPPMAESSLNDQVIRIDSRITDRLAAGFQGAWRRPPTDEEAAGLLDSYIIEEVLVREAQKLGLEAGDQVVRQRLRLKMEFLIEGAVLPGDPGDAVLQAYLEEQTVRFSVPGKVAFEQVYLGENPSPIDVAAAIAALSEGADFRTLGVRSLLPASVPSAPAQAIDSSFGTGVFAALSAAQLGAWSGPIRSGYGQHLVRVTENTEARLPALSDIRARVLSAWQEAQAEGLKLAEIDTLRAMYDVQMSANEGGS